MGDQLAKQRRLARLSQAKLAELSGISSATVKAIERGTTNPKPATLERLARGLATDEEGMTDSEAFDQHYLLLAQAAGIAPKGAVGRESDSGETPDARVNRILAEHPEIKVAFAKVDDFDDDDAEMVEQVLEYVAKRSGEKRQRDRERRR